MGNEKDMGAQLLLAFASDFEPVKETITADDLTAQKSKLLAGEFEKAFDVALELDYVGGMVRATVHPERIEVMGKHPYREDTSLVVAIGGTFTYLDPRRPFFSFRPDRCGMEKMPLMTCGGESLGDGWVAKRQPLMEQENPDGSLITSGTKCWVGPLGESEQSLSTFGEEGVDPDNMFIHYNTEEGAYLVFGDLYRAVLLLVALGSASFEYDKNASEETRKIMHEDTRALRIQVDPITKLAKKLMDPRLFEDNGVDLDVAGDNERKAGKDIATAVSLEWHGEGLKIYRELSAWDREVHAAVSSLWHDGQRVVTPAKVARAMGIRRPKAQLEHVAESMDLQMRVFGRIDFSKEARDRELKVDGEPVEEFTLESALIPARKANIRTSNGRVVEGYELLAEPLVYAHARAVHQLVSYPQHLLELGEGSDTKTNLLIRRELVRRVKVITRNWRRAGEKGKPAVIRTIRFLHDPKHDERQSLFDYAEVKQEDREVRTNATKFALSVLDGLQREGEIAGYRKRTERRRGGSVIAGVEIVPAVAGKK